ncbi:MAG: DUF3800 domain-containing protein [Candidatus Omnitrophica bacterium]|nr:DUF3800 domain-containing protein [Candidatus Omnitrophota bacterium]MBU4457678.1 DUF3800 domain-containing protein [Candidatus Omnitrophota bacterium]
MWFLYLDESGDLGFDFVSKKPSNYFTITILAISDYARNRAIIKAAAKTLKRKLNRKLFKRRVVHELKASETTLDIKKYLYKQMKDVKFGIYSITLNKRRVYKELAEKKSHVYNYISRLVLDKIPFEEAPERVYLTIDKSKSKLEIQEFNKYIITQLKGRLDPKIPLDIYHFDSIENKGLQVADMFCWGIFRKYERKDLDWYDVFNDKVIFDDLYLP